MQQPAENEKQNFLNSSENIELTILQNTFILSPLKAVFLPDSGQLVLSDLHVGKAAHFRRHGIPVTAEVMQADLQRLSRLIKEFDPVQLVVVGDMFHHSHNADVAGFGLWRKAFHHLPFLLVAGNHDKLTTAHYAGMQIEVCNKFTNEPFCFVHEKPKPEDGKYFISGHVHPGITLTGRARQHVRIPCFVVGKNYLILPAFSNFTGLDTLSTVHSEADVFAIVNNRLIKV